MERCSLGCVGRPELGPFPVKLVDLVLMVLIGCALVFLLWELHGLIR